MSPPPASHSPPPSRSAFSITTHPSRRQHPTNKFETQWGQCVSSGGAASEAAPAKATALVLLPAGDLREYPRPVTAARVLEDIDSDDSSEGWFLCDSDRMGFEGPVAAVCSGDELRVGRIHFVLSVDARRRGFTREEVAALAVKAADALATRAAAASSGRRTRGGAAVAPLVFSPTEAEEGDEQTVGAAHKPIGKRRPAAARSRGSQRRFAPDLAAIPECDTSE